MNKQIIANKRNTVLIIAGFVAFIALIGAVISYAVSDWHVAVVILVIAAAYAIFQYFMASKLAVAMTGAREISRQDNPKLYNTVEKVASMANVPMPKVYIINDSAPNAFATGRDPKHSIIAVTTGLMDIMNNNELTAIVGHEMSHIKNYDIRVSMITFGLVCIVGAISDLGLRMLFYGNRRSRGERSPVGVVLVLFTSILAPIAASIAQLAVSREREYLADASSAKITHYPDGMISALKKLDTHGRPMKQQNSATEAMFINNPLKKGTFSNLFSTHPPIEKRIERLEHGKTQL